jgi:hypothetical protein
VIAGGGALTVLAPFHPMLLALGYLRRNATVIN